MAWTLSSSRRWTNGIRGIPRISASARSRWASADWRSGVSSWISFTFATPSLKIGVRLARPNRAPPGAAASPSALRTTSWSCEAAVVSSVAAATPRRTATTGRLKNGMAPAIRNVTRA